MEQIPARLSGRLGAAFGESAEAVNAAVLSLHAAVSHFEDVKYTAWTLYNAGFFDDEAQQYLAAAEQKARAVVTEERIRISKEL